MRICATISKSKCNKLTALKVYIMKVTMLNSKVSSHTFKILFDIFLIAAILLMLSVSFLIIPPLLIPQEEKENFAWINTEYSNGLSSNEFNKRYKMIKEGMNKEDVAKLLGNSVPEDRPLEEGCTLHSINRGGILSLLQISIPFYVRTTICYNNMNEVKSFTQDITPE